MKNRPGTDEALILAAVDQVDLLGYHTTAREARAALERLVAERDEWQQAHLIQFREREKLAARAERLTAERVANARRTAGLLLPVTSAWERSVFIRSLRESIGFPLELSGPEGPS
jgi:hypothetical protein